MKIFSLIGIKWDFTYPAHIHDLGEDFWVSYFGSDNIHCQFKLLESKPSIVQTTFKEHFLRTVVAYLLKAPWYIFGNYWKLVGGWEVFVQKIDKDD
jgi:hypothetical protein